MVWSHVFPNKNEKQRSHKMLLLTGFVELLRFRREKLNKRFDLITALHEKWLLVEL